MTKKNGRTERRKKGGREEQRVWQNNKSEGIYIHIDLFRYRMREEVKSVAHGEGKKGLHGGEK